MEFARRQHALLCHRRARLDASARLIFLFHSRPDERGGPDSLAMATPNRASISRESVIASFVMIRAILFDMGGTLDGDGLHWLDRFAGLYQKFGASFPREKVRAAFDEAERRSLSDENISS